MKISSTKAEKIWRVERGQRLDIETGHDSLKEKSPTLDIYASLVTFWLEFGAKRGGGPLIGSMVVDDPNFP